jgi:hypothetical protein
MVQIWADAARRTRMGKAFTLDAMTALTDMKSSGLSYELADVRSYFSAMSRHRADLQAKPQAPQPTRLD